MNDSPPDLIDPKPAGAAGRPLLAWIVILIVAAVSIGGNACVDPAEDDGSQADIEKLLLRIQAQYLIGAARLANGGDVYQQAAALNTGSVDQRQRFVLVAAELAGPEEAGDVLLELDDLMVAHGIEMTAAQLETQETLHRLYTRDGAPVSDDEAEHAARLAALSPADSVALEQEFGWLAGAALAPEDIEGVSPERRDAFLAAARRLTLSVVSGFVTLGLLGIFGLVGIVAAVILLINGKLSSGLGAPRPYHAVYAETFAVWFVVFVVFQLVAGLLTVALPGLQLVAVIGGFLASLVALAWPVARGVPWDTVRRDIGLTAGRPPWLEPLIGAGGYLSALPILAVGMLLTLMLLFLQSFFAGERGPFEPAGGPAHPIVLQLVESGWWLKVQVLLIASVAAPIVEETMFRGVLYRHLRDASAKFGLGLSILISGSINGFLFAAIHPQGWVAIPALMSLAWSFILLREWRGTLVPSMVLHGVSNGLVMLGLLAILSFS